MALYLYDSFTVAGSGPLENHTPDLGGAWAKHPNFAAGATVNATNDWVVGDSASTAIYYNAATPGSADYDVSATVRASNVGTGLPGVLARLDPTASSFYQAHLANSTTIELQRLVAGSATVLATHTGTFANNTNYRMTLRVHGSDITVFLNGLQIISHTDATPITAAGKAGLRTRSTGSVDDFVLADALNLETNLLVENGIWSWFSEPRVLYDGAGVYYIGSISNAGSARISKYTVSSGALIHFTLRSQMEIDDHDNAVPIILPNGKIACFYSKHNTGTEGTSYRISTNAAPDISAFDAEIDLAAGQTEPTTYSNPFYVPDANKIIMFYRAFSSPNFTQGFRTAAADLSSWDAEVLLAKGSSDTVQAYFKFAANGANRIDVLCTDNHPINGATSVFHFYAQWDTSAFKFFKSDGTEITATKPWRTNTEATQIYDGTSESSWIWDIRIGSDGHPRVLFTRFPTTTDHRYYFSRWTGSAWTTPVQIAAAGTHLYSAQANYSGGASFDGNSVDICYLSIESGGVWEMSVWETSDNGATWAKTADITTGNQPIYKRARPYSPNGHEGAIGVAYWQARYNSFTSYTESGIFRYANVTGGGGPETFGFFRRRIG